jgi:hypothetical protein
MKSPYAAEQASYALAAFHKKEIMRDPAVKMHMFDYLWCYNLAYAVPSSLKDKDGWRDEWEPHILYATRDCVEAVKDAASTAWESENAISAVAGRIDLDM